jgi:HEPN domain-containing protein
MGGEDPGSLLASSAQPLFEWLQRSAATEIERRRARGAWSDDELYRIQMLYWADRASELRLNREVQGAMLACATRDLNAGEHVSLDDFSEITAYYLAEDEHDAAHITALRHRGGWSLAMSFSYNAARIIGHIEAADEFLATARHALGQRRLRAFAESAFSAAELYAKAELLSLPDKRLMTAGHSTVSRNYSLWTRLGNADHSFSALLHRLTRLRADSRYLRREARVTEDDAALMLATLDRMAHHVRATRPRPSVGDPDARVRSLRIVTHRAVRTGELLVVPPEGALALLRHAA